MTNLIDTFKEAGFSVLAVGISKDYYVLYKETGKKVTIISEPDRTAIPETLTEPIEVYVCSTTDFNNNFFGNGTAVIFPNSIAYLNK